ncbi:MAG: hypothetical protein ACPGQC_05465 [Limisphaerales bacterium]
MPTCQVVPLPDNQVSLQIDGKDEVIMATRAGWINKTGRRADLFNVSPGFTLSQAKRKHRKFEVAR